MEIPKGYNLEPPEGYKKSKIDPAIQAMIDGATSISLEGSALNLEQGATMKHYYEALRNFENGGTEIELKNDPHLLVSQWALFAPMREYVITKVKLPLQKAIESAKTLSDVSKQLMSTVKKIPFLRKKNTSFRNTHILIEKRDLLLKYHDHRGRHKLMEAAFNLDIFEYEHDGYYAFIQDWLLIELATELAKGNWVPRFHKFPIPHCWIGPELPDIETIREQLREALKNE